MKREYVITIMLLAVLVACSAPASAKVLEQVQTVESGTVNGGVYVGGGAGSGDNPYTQNFSVPNSTDILWSRLYVHVWASGKSSGWLNITYWNGTANTQNDKYLEYDYGESGTPNVNNDSEGYYVSCGYGVYWRYWNVTDITESGDNGVVASTSTTQTHGPGHFDIGDITGIALVTLYDDGGDPVVYWINQGYVHMGDYPCAVPSSTTWFNDSIDTGADATLWTMYLTGNDGQPDYLYFNGNELSSDAADGCGSSPDSTWCGGMDMDSWAIDAAWLDPSNNNATFVNGVPPDGGSGGESSLRAVVAVMTNESEPDLNVTDIDPYVTVGGQTPIALVAGHTYTINATIKNKGVFGAYDFNVTLREDGVLKDDTFISSLGKYAETVVQFDWTTSAGDDYNLTVTADAYDDVKDELDEDNNASTETVTVLPSGVPADIGLTSSDIALSPTYGNNNTTIRVKLTNWGTTDASNFNVAMDVRDEGNTLVYSTSTTTSLDAMHYRYVEFEYDASLAGSPYDITITVSGVSGETVTGNNTATKSLTVVTCRILDSHHWGNASAYNGDLSSGATVNMFDITKLAPENTTPVDLLASVANITAGASTPVASVEYNGQKLEQGTENIGGETVHHYWYPYVNDIPVSWGNWTAYPVQDGDVVHWDILAYINKDFKPRPVMDYPEPFLHGYDGTVYNTIIVYPDELLYPDKADAVEAGLLAAGVPSGRISTKAVGTVTTGEKQSNNLILLGTPSNNDLIEYVNSKHVDVGMPVYFSGSQMIDDSDDTAYDVGGVVEACDNPYDGADWKDTGPSVWLAAGIEDFWAYKAADMLASDTGKLDRFWVVREPYLVPTLGSVILDWGNWPGTCASFNIYITNDLSAGFPATPNATTSATSWTDTNADDDPQRYYKVTCIATGEQIEGNVTKITYDLMNGKNWITMPTMNPPLTNADELIQHISQTGQPLDCDEKVGWWNPTSQSGESYGKMPSPPFPPGTYGGTNFDVKPARGYEVTVSADTSETVVGWVPDCPLKLIAGKNWIGMPFDTMTGDADELIQHISQTGQPLDCDEKVGWWNPTSQSGESYGKMPSPPFPPGTYGGTNFDVKPARGYEVTVSTDTIWTPE